MDKPKLYKATELAEILRCDPQTIYRKADRGEIKDRRVGKMRRFLMPKGDEQNNAENRG